MPLIFSVAFEARTLLFLHVRAVSKSTPGSSLPGPYIFGTFARTSAKCSTVSAWDRKLRESQTRDLGGFATKIFCPPGFPNYSTTTVALASQTRHLQISRPPFVFASSSPLRLRSSSAPSPPPLLPTVLALISENTTDPKISKRYRARNSEFHAMLIWNKVVYLFFLRRA